MTEPECQKRYAKTPLKTLLTRLHPDPASEESRQQPQDWYSYGPATESPPATESLGPFLAQFSTIS